MKSAIVLAAFFSGSSFAVGIGNDNPGGGTQTQNVSSYTHSSAQAASSAKATGVGLGVGLGVGVGLGGAGGAGGSAVSNSAGGKAVATSGSSTATGGNPVGNGGASSVTYNEAPAAQQRGTVTIKNTPDVTLSNIAPSADCMGVTTLGGSVSGFSAAGGTSWESRPCQLRETARIFHALGKPDDAIAILCSSEYAAAAPSCKALKKD